MLDPRWQKIVRDLWSHRTRTILVVASIAVGIFAVGTVQYLRTVVLGEMQKVYDQSLAAHATIFAQVDDAMLETIRRMPEIDAAEGRSSLSVTIEVEPGRWEPLSITMVDDFENVQVNALELVYSVDAHPDVGAERTRWPRRDEVILERSSLDARNALPAGLAVGDTLQVETAGERRRTLDVSGLLYAPTGFPSTFTGSGSGYVTRETFERLGGDRDYTQVNIRVTGTPEQLADREYITRIAESAGDKIERSGRTVQRIQVPTPGRLPLQDLFDSIALLLTPLGLLALFLSGFLVINTISALMSQQVRQIGVMKSIGARRGQITGMYLSAVLIYSLLALAVAVPMTMVVGGGIAGFLGSFINITFPRWVLPWNIVVLEAVVGILIPLAAALWPVRRGTTVTVREAISDFGLGKGQFGKDWLGRMLARLRLFSRPLQISLRNTFRRRARLALTLITLTLGGMIFMTVGSVRLSLGNLVESALAYNQFDIQIAFERSYRTAQVTQIVEAVPGVTNVETWGSGQATRVRSDGTESDPISIFALPPNSTMVQPTLIGGRWLLPEDENAVVISQRVISEEPDVEVGDTLTLEIAGREGEWVVVGVAQVLGGPPNQIPAYVNYPFFSRTTGNVGRASSVQLQVADQDPDAVNAKLLELETALEDAGLRVSSTFTINQIRRFTGAFFDIIIYLLLAMGVLIASVGALGLMGTMSTNVLERTREIGVMRAIGASDAAIQRIVIAEGIVIGFISWFMGGLLAFPVGLGLSSAVGAILFSTPLPFSFSVSGVFTWLAIVAVLAGLASFLPAWNASRLTVREVLAYE